MKVDKGNAKHWLLLAQQAVYTVITILVRPFYRKPEKPIVVLYGHQFSGNLKALYEQWELTHQGKLSLYFLTLDPESGQQLEQAGVQVLRCNRLTDMLQLARARAMITDHGLHMMAPLVRFTDIRFIDVWHGIPFKGFTPDDFKLQHRYDEVWVSSPLLKQIYQDQFGFRPEIVLDMGYARTDKLFRNDPPTAEIKKTLAIPSDKKIVLYAPTWQQDDKGRALFPFNQTQQTFIEQLARVCREGNSVLVIRSHLNTLVGQHETEGVSYASMQEYPDTESLLIESDVLICDWSSIAFDYLALNRPTIFLDVKPPFKNGFSLGAEYRFGKIVADMGSLNGCLGDALNSPDLYFAQQRQNYLEICSVVYGDMRDKLSAKRQLDHLLAALQYA